MKFKITRTLIAFTIAGWAKKLEDVDFNKTLKAGLIKLLNFVALKVGV